SSEEAGRVSAVRLLLQFLGLMKFNTMGSRLVKPAPGVSGGDVERADVSCCAHGRSIPTGLRPPAQGCEERATLGRPDERSATPTGLWPYELVPSHRAATLSGLDSSPSCPRVA